MDILYVTISYMVTLYSIFMQTNVLYNVMMCVVCGMSGVCANSPEQYC